MKYHLAISLLAFFMWGCALMLFILGEKAGLSHSSVFVTFYTSLILYVVIVLTSLEKVKSKLFKKEDDEANNGNALKNK